MNRLEAALKFFTDNVTYLDKEQAKKMALEGRSLTYRAFLAGYDEDKDMTLHRLENSYQANLRLHDEVKKLKDDLKEANQVQFDDMLVKNILKEQNIRLKKALQKCKDQRNLWIYESSDQTEEEIIADYDKELEKIENILIREDDGI